MKYRREAVFPRKFLVGFTEEQRAALDRIADRDERSVASIVRECVDLHLRSVSDRQRGRRSARRVK